MPVLNRLVELFESRGFRVATGLNPTHFGNYALAPFTWLIEDGKSYSEGLGIGMQEIYFLECLFADFHPHHFFVVGNSFGWSTFAMALINPQAKVVAIDDGSGRNALEGIDFTNRVAAEEGLDIRVVQGRSPEDVSTAIEDHLNGRVDFAFIDGCHTDEHIVLDFNAIHPYAPDGCVYLFHDVHQYDLHAGFERVAQESGLPGRILMGTPSGMGIVYDPDKTPPIKRTVETFAADQQTIDLIEQEAWKASHHYRAKYKRSLIKRLNALRRLFGKAPLPLP